MHLIKDVIARRDEARQAVTFHTPTSQGRSYLTGPFFRCTECARLARTLAVMATHESQVSEGTIQALKTLIGRRVHTVYAPILDVAGTHIAAQSFAILISGQIGNQWSHRFLNLKAIWSETPRFLHDYWELQAFEDQRPLGISVDAENAMLSPV